jgi:two-component system LytT family response regulator
MGAFPMLHGLAKPPSPRVALKLKGQILFLDLGDVLAVHAEGNYVRLQRDASSYLLRESISVVAEKLAPHGFVRVHRSFLVNASCVEAIEPRPNGEYALRIRGGNEYTVTRTYKENLGSLATLWIGTSPFLTDGAPGRLPAKGP